MDIGITGGGVCLAFLVGAGAGLGIWMLTAIVRVVICWIVGQVPDQHWMDTNAASWLFGLERRK